MSNIGKITLGSSVYHVAKAPADKQKKLLALIGARVAFNSASGQIEKINEDAVYGVLLGMGEDTVDQVADIVLYSCVKPDQPKVPIDVGSFQNNMHEYFMLISLAVVENLADFFTYLDNVNKQTRAQAQSTATV